MTTLWRFSIAMILMTASVAFGAQPSVAFSDGTEVGPRTTTTNASSSFEHEKFEYQKTLEEKKLEVERLKAWLTGGSILIPLLLGLMTLTWQTRATEKQKERDARDAFELKAADIALSGNSPTGTKNKAKALAALFPERLPKNFGGAFDPNDFKAPSTDVRIEVFKMASSKVTTPAEVAAIWHQLFPGDKWIEPLL